MSLPSLRVGRLGVLLAALALACSAQAADPPQESPQQALAQLLDSQRSALAVDAQGLSGPGAATLLERARKAQFILVGEDHGFADVPRFVLALRQSLGADAPAHLALEIGPYAARRLTRAIRQDGQRQFALDYPAALPFFGWQEDNQMAAAWQRGNTRDVLWGLDQEFIFGTRLYFERLRELAGNERARQLIATHLQRNAEADKAVIARHDSSLAYFPQISKADYAVLREAMQPAAGSEAAALLDGLDESAEIYRTQSTTPHESNTRRAQLMKRQFMQYYQAAQRDGQALPRVLFRLGGYHAMRGLTPTNQFDIANFASEFAAGNGQASLHVLVIAAGGTVNRWLPFVADEKQKAAAYDAKADLGDWGPLLFAQHALPQGWTVFPTEPLRSTRRARKAGGAEFERIVYGFDYIVVVAQGTAAQNYTP
jgi:hypothetical protein